MKKFTLTLGLVVIVLAFTFSGVARASTSSPAPSFGAEITAYVIFIGSIITTAPITGGELPKNLTPLQKEFYVLNSHTQTFDLAQQAAGGITGTWASVSQEEKSLFNNVKSESLSTLVGQ
jgi:hypothetical protein